MIRLTDFHKRSLDNIVAQIAGNYSVSGGDWDINEMIRDAEKANNLSDEEVEYIRMRLIKRISSYEG